jgi:hypothetical protein
MWGRRRRGCPRRGHYYSETPVVNAPQLVPRGVGAEDGGAVKTFVINTPPPARRPVGRFAHMTLRCLAGVTLGTRLLRGENVRSIIAASMSQRIQALLKKQIPPNDQRRGKEGHQRTTRSVRDSGEAAAWAFGATPHRPPSLFRTTAVLSLLGARVRDFELPVLVLLAGIQRFRRRRS